MISTTPPKVKPGATCLLLVSLKTLGRLAAMTASLSLFALSGLPGAGKSTVAAALAHDAAAVVVSVDPIEDALHRAGLTASHETGLAAYLVAEVVARESLTLGHPVVVDAANYVEEARRMWRDLAQECAAELTWVEVVCSDEALHRQRLAARDRGFDASLEPSWENVRARRADTAPWSAADQDILVRIDTARPLDAQLGDLTERLVKNRTRW